MVTNNPTNMSEGSLEQLLKAFCDSSLLRASEIADDCSELVSLVAASAMSKESVLTNLKWFYEIYHYLDMAEIESGCVPFEFCYCWENSIEPENLHNVRKIELADFIILSGNKSASKKKVLFYNSLKLYDILKTHSNLWEPKGFYRPRVSGPLQEYNKWVLKGKYSQPASEAVSGLPPLAVKILDHVGDENYRSVIKNVPKFRLLEQVYTDTNFKDALNTSAIQTVPQTPKIDKALQEFWDTLILKKSFTDRHEAIKKARHDIWNDYKVSEPLLATGARRLGDNTSSVHVIEATSTQGPKYVTVCNLLSEYDHLVVPIYQRNYEWSDLELSDMHTDLTELTLQSETLPLFLGTILLQCGPAGSQEMEVLDGQQRILTFYLICAWACKLLKENGEGSKARAIVKKYLAVTDEPVDGVERFVPRFTPDARDQKALGEILDSCIAVDWDFAKWGSHMSEAGTGEAVKQQFRNIERIFGPSIHTAGLLTNIQPLCNMLIKLFQVCYVCRFVLNERDDPFDTFKRLNHFGKPLHNSDLLKSAILKRVGKNELKEFHDTRWLPFATKVGEKDTKDEKADRYRRSQLDKFFTCFAKIKNPTCNNKRTVYTLTEYWATIESVDKIIDEINEVAEIWKLLNEPTPTQINMSLSTFGGDITIAVMTLGLLNPPTEFVPFVLSMLHAKKDGKCNEQNVIACLQLLSSWLIRNNLIVEGATTLHGLQSVFTPDTYTSLADSGFDPKMLFDKIDRIEYAIQNLTDAQFKQSLLDTEIGLPKFKKRKAILFAIDNSDEIHGFGAPLTLNHTARVDQYAKFSVEHVAPQNPAAGEWAHMRDHQNLIHKLGNLVGLSVPDNASCSNDEFDIKLRYITLHSQFISARKLQEVKSDPSWKNCYNEQWGHLIIEARTEAMCDLLVKLFPLKAESSKHLAQPDN
jgi:hypothetical protein